MKNALILAVGLAFFATGAVSQESSRDRDDSGRGGWSGRHDEWDRARDRSRGPMMRDDDEDWGRPDAQGARFFLRSGDTQLRVVCGSRESTQACVDAALRLFDRMQSQQGAATRTPSAPAPTQPPQ
ncbi:hypothetical protein [Microvirga calopogonii]|uniref:hypothetical protein n=1 Tax=Microvirga calopogonii TaxID=2078013 RepID=UPI000E0D696F|nr:hypothetical protein [Microvirga calopogonii]